MCHGTVVSRTYNYKPAQKRILTLKGFPADWQPGHQTGRPILKMEAPAP
jgi:hypothetical protein